MTSDESTTVIRRFLDWYMYDDMWPVVAGVALLIIAAISAWTYKPDILFIGLMVVVGWLGIGLGYFNRGTEPNAED